MTPGAQGGNKRIAFYAEIIYNETTVGARHNLLHL